jgi:hypothetical protein
MKEAMKLREVPNEGVKLLLVALAQDVRPGNGCDVWPGLKTLAGRMGVARRTAERRKAAAIRAGLISATPRHRREGRGRTSDLIHLDFLDDQPDNSCRAGRATINPTDLDDQPDSLGTSNPTTGVGGLEKEERKESEQEEDDSFAVAQTRKDDTFVSPEQEDSFGQRRGRSFATSYANVSKNDKRQPQPGYELTPSRPKSPPSPRPLDEPSDADFIAIAQEHGLGLERLDGDEWVTVFEPEVVA